MRDQNGGGTGLLAGGVEHLENLRLDRDVQGGGRLIGDDDVRLVGHRDRDDDALAHAAGELVRIAVRTVACVRDTDEFEQVDCPGLGGLAGDVLVVLAHGLGDLVTDLVDRIQGCHRILEDHRDALAADLTELLVAQVQHLLAAELHRAGDPGALRQQTHDRQRCHRLTGARLAHDPEDLAGANRVAHAPHCADKTIFGGKLNIEVGHLEHST